MNATPILLPPARAAVPLLSVSTPPPLSARGEAGSGRDRLGSFSLGGALTLHGLVALLILFLPAADPIALSQSQEQVFDIVYEAPPPIVEAKPALANTPYQPISLPEPEPDPAPAPEPVEAVSEPPSIDEPAPESVSAAIPFPMAKPEPPKRKAQAQPKPLVSVAIQAASTPALDPSTAPPIALPSTSSTTTVEDENMVRARFLSRLAARIQAVLSYPRRSRSRRESGTTMIQVTLASTGHLEQCRVERSSGHKALDKEACAAAERALPLPIALPSHTSQIRVPVSFVLK